MLLVYLSANFAWELCSLRYNLRFLELCLFEQVLNLDVVILLNELDHQRLVTFVSHEQEDHIVLDFDLDDFLVGSVEYGHLVLEVADLNLIVLGLDNVALEELHKFLLARYDVTEVFSRREPIETLDRVRAIPAHVKDDVTVQVAVDGAAGNHLSADVRRD